MQPTMYRRCCPTYENGKNGNREHTKTTINKNTTATLEETFLVQTNICSGAPHIGYTHTYTLSRSLIAITFGIFHGPTHSQSRPIFLCSYYLVGYYYYCCSESRVMVTGVVSMSHTLEPHMPY